MHAIKKWGSLAVLLSAVVGLSFMAEHEQERLEKEAKSALVAVAHQSKNEFARVLPAESVQFNVLPSGVEILTGVEERWFISDVDSNILGKPTYWKNVKVELQEHVAVCFDLTPVPGIKDNGDMSCHWASRSNS